VPIVPVGIEGAHAAFPVGAWFPRPRRITIRFGEPILPAEVEALAADRKARLQAATTHIMRRIARLNRTRAREDELAAPAAAN
jgi:1-acyl-sn-glycerol-3-phosphate acyltransferase